MIPAPLSQEERAYTPRLTTYQLASFSQLFSDLQILALTSRITELSYSVSEIQTSIFEVQELRHKSQALGDGSNPTGVIDKSLGALDERLDTVAEGVKSVSESIQPLLDAPPSDVDDTSERSVLLRKYEAFTAEWEAVQQDSDVLREELKEDKWLTVFRTVTDQADGMMSSLEKAVNRCQDFIWQVHRHGPEDMLSPSSSMASMTSSVRSDKSPYSLEVYQNLLDSFEAKKKHYMPATTKVLTIIDKGVQDRVTKNGECLRRHAESTQRWKQLRDRIARTDAEMESVRRILLAPADMTPSESASSNTSGPTSKSRTGYLTPPSNSGSAGKKSSGKDTLARSISPFRKFARRFTGSSKSPSVPPAPLATPANPSRIAPRTPVSEPVRTLRGRSSMFLFGAPAPVSPGHKHSQSMTPENSPRQQAPDDDANVTIKARGTPPARLPWNSSTKLDDENAGIARSRRPSASGLPPVDRSPYKRSLSRSSMASSARPFSPMTSTTSTVASTTPSHVRAPSRGAPSRAQTPHALQPRTRPRTPSYIPSPALDGPVTPSAHRRGASVAPSDSGYGDYDDSPTRSGHGRAPSRAGAMTPGGTRLPHPRPPSRSMIPAPKLHVSTPSRPGSALSDYFARAASPTSSVGHGYTPGSSFRSMAMRAQTPESTLKLRAGQAMGIPTTPSTPGFPRASRGPPSSFRDTPGSVGRAASRNGYGYGNWGAEAEQHIYVPANARDPLDTEVAAVVNAIEHGLRVERIDPPLRVPPKEGTEVRAQYAFTSVLGRKVVSLKLTTLARPGGGTGTKKVMARVGGGWIDLAVWLSSRSA
ncbi:hypothetical protein K488DRAFT_46627 [Vararia minispora EC-137]|uniref:Uncharacterized protein n=1 Tax=Vararia minispora EC-137 TaxID=1314806 RepID=A0ACB8QPY6_9AGAM|nr:hypothetical protein K488DRAFT_46627 [Vararia minispora EC-137]